MKYWITILVSSLLSGGITAIVTLRSTKKKSEQDVKTAIQETKKLELDNVEKAVQIWRELAEKFEKELTESQKRNEKFARQIEQLEKKVDKLNTTSNKILKMIDKITPQNFEKIVEQIKKELYENN